MAAYARLAWFAPAAFLRASFFATAFFARNGFCVLHLGQAQISFRYSLK